MQLTSERKTVLQRLVQVSYESAFGLKPTDEQALPGLLTEAVKAKLLTAEQSYQLREKILDRSIFHRAIDRRVDTRLKRTPTF